MKERFCSLDQLYKKFSGNDVFPSPKLNEDQKQEKGLRRNFEIIFGRKFVGSFTPGWLFFLWSSGAQLSVGGRLHLDGGTLNLDGGRVPPTI